MRHPYRSGREPFSATTDGTPHVGLNARYVLAALEALEGKDLRVRYADSEQPVVFTDPADANRLQLVMAMRVT